MVIALKKLSHCLLLSRLSTLIFIDAADLLGLTNILHLDLVLKLHTHGDHSDVSLKRSLLRLPPLL